MSTTTIPPLAAEAIAHHLGVALPLTLTLPAHGRTGAERSALLARGLEQARAAGLLNADGLDRFVWDAFHLLDRPGTTVYFSQGQVAARRDRHVVAASDETRALLAELDTNGLALTPIRPTGIAAELAALLPPASPAPGPRSATARRSLVTDARNTANGSPAAMAKALTDRQVHHTDARLIAEALTARPSVITEICAVPGEPPVHLIDTAAGRYVIAHRGDHVLVMPGHPDLIRHEIDKLAPVHRTGSTLSREID
jgi:hypothetical protein